MGAIGAGMHGWLAVCFACGPLRRQTVNLFWDPCIATKLKTVARLSSVCLEERAAVGVSPCYTRIAQLLRLQFKYITIPQRPGVLREVDVVNFFKRQFFLDIYPRKTQTGCNLMRTGTRSRAGVRAGAFAQECLKHLFLSRGMSASFRVL